MPEFCPVGTDVDDCQRPLLLYGTLIANHSPSGYIHSDIVRNHTSPTDSFLAAFDECKQAFDRRMETPRFGCVGYAKTFSSQAETNVGRCASAIAARTEVETWTFFIAFRRTTERAIQSALAQCYNAGFGSDYCRKHFPPSRQTPSIRAERFWNSRSSLPVAYLQRRTLRAAYSFSPRHGQPVRRRNSLLSECARSLRARPESCDSARTHSDSFLLHPPIVGAIVLAERWFAGTALLTHRRRSNGRSTILT